MRKMPVSHRSRRRSHVGAHRARCSAPSYTARYQVGSASSSQIPCFPRRQGKYCAACAEYRPPRQKPEPPGWASSASSSKCRQSCRWRTRWRRLYCKITSKEQSRLSTRVGACDTRRPRRVRFSPHGDESNSPKSCSHMKLTQRWPTTFALG